MQQNGMKQIKQILHNIIQMDKMIRNTRKKKKNNKQERKNTFTREKDVKKDEIDDLIEKMNRMEIKLANTERGKINRNINNNGVVCYNCGNPGHIARNCETREI